MAVITVSLKTTSRGGGWGVGGGAFEHLYIVPLMHLWGEVNVHNSESGLSV